MKYFILTITLLLSLSLQAQKSVLPITNEEISFSEGSIKWTDSGITISADKDTELDLYLLPLKAKYIKDGTTLSAQFGNLKWSITRKSKVYTLKTTGAYNKTVADKLSVVKKTLRSMIDLMLIGD